MPRVFPENQSLNDIKIAEINFTGTRGVENSDSILNIIKYPIIYTSTY